MEHHWYRLELEYDGSAYVGWQRQAVGRSIQGAVEQALERILGGYRPKVVGSGRTDSGVHALCQVASFSAPVSRSPRALCRGLNSELPRDIACRRAMEVPPGFDACRHACCKTYRYRYLDGVARSPLRERFVWHLPRVLDAPAMAEAGAQLEGTHDFTSFRAGGSDAATSVRTLRRVRVERVEDEVQLWVVGEGFLRHMVRIMAGTLEGVGSGRLSPSAVAEVVRARDRTRAGKTAPAKGLCLLEVAYPRRWTTPQAPEDAED